MKYILCPCSSSKEIKRLKEKFENIGYIFEPSIKHGYKGLLKVFEERGVVSISIRNYIDIIRNIMKNNLDPKDIIFIDDILDKDFNIISLKVKCPCCGRNFKEN
jgi:hypothetical protein